MRVVDAHLHAWDESELTYTWLKGPLAHRFAGEELRRASILADGAVESIFVQAGTIERDYLAEVRWAQSQAEAARIVGIVAGALLDRGPRTTAHLDELAAHPRVVGVRHNLQDEPTGTAVSAAFLAGARELAARGWTFDICVRAHQLPEIAALAEAVPDLRMVLDHVGKPVIGTSAAPIAPSPEWRRDIAALAAHPGVFCKVSGLPAEAGGAWSAEMMTPFLDAAAEAFGADRLIWGSDWPVSALEPAESTNSDGPASAELTYRTRARRRWLDAVVAWSEERGHDTDALLWSTARRAYRLDESDAVEN